MHWLEPISHRDGTSLGSLQRFLGKLTIYQPCRRVEYLQITIVLLHLHSRPAEFSTSKQEWNLIVLLRALHSHQRPCHIQCNTTLSSIRQPNCMPSESTAENITGTFYSLRRIKHAVRNVTEDTRTKPQIESTLAIPALPPVHLCRQLHCNVEALQAN